MLCLVYLRGPSWGTRPTDTSLTQANPKLGEWSGDMICPSSSLSHALTLQNPSLAPLMKQLQWEADYSKSLKSMSVCYKCAFRKIATNDHTLHLALNQPALIWVRVAHTQEQAVSNTMIICCLTKDRLSPGDSGESVLDFKSGGILLPLTWLCPLGKSPLWPRLLICK